MLRKVLVLFYCWIILIGLQWVCCKCWSIGKFVFKRQQNCPLHSGVGFVSSLACLNRSTTGFMRPKVQVSFHRKQELCFVLWLDCTADSGQLSCTCHWSSVPKGQFLLSISTARKHLKVHASLWMGWPHLPLPPPTHTQESTLLLIYRVTASEKVVFVSNPSVPIHCVWFYVAHGESDSQHS